jgi:hypothetical protein
MLFVSSNLPYFAFKLTVLLEIWFMLGDVKSVICSLCVTADGFKI